MASFHYILMAVACATIFVMMLPQGEAIRCYVCNSHNDTRCAENEPPEHLLVECSNTKEGSKYTFCRKIVQVIEFSVNNLPPDTRTIRSCGWEEGNYAKKCYQRSGFGGRQEVCACSEDKCNGAATIKATFGVLLASVVMLIVRA